MGEFLYIIYQVLKIYLYIMFVYILLSWTPLVKSKFYDVLRRICEPYLGIFRGKLVISNMDFGGLFGLILLQLLLMFIGKTIF